jgi:RNA polymerase sigma-70 factor (ECF subfamily)
MAGDREAFDALVRRYESQIFNLARALTNGDADADDLAQEAFIRAYRGIRTFRGDSSFRTWLHTVTVNVARSHRAKRSRWRALWASPSVDRADGSAEPREAVTPSFEAETLRRDGIDKALATLPEDLRVAVTLRDIQGLEYREIAEVLGIPRGTVESRIFRARQRLMPLLQPLLVLSRDASHGSRVPLAAPIAE